MTMTIDLQFAQTRGGREDFKNYSEEVDRFDAEMLESLRAKHDADGWWLINWRVVETSPRTEGFEEAAAGLSAEDNPYATTFWKHAEWLVGWSRYQKSRG